MDHLSHLNHPLKLIENKETVFSVGGEGKQVCCDWCQKPISDGDVYGCIRCHYYLHKTCVPVEVPYHHYLHPLHPLTLFHFNHMYQDWSCTICELKQKTRFSYYCSLCDFDVCMQCAIADVASNAATIALKEEASKKFTHAGHHPQHTLTLQLRPASFHCNACRYKKEDFFYQCDNCDFWIHKTCASLTTTIDLPFHDKHPLFLAYSLPEQFCKFAFYCMFCQKRIMQCDWIYHCENCRNFIHIKCVSHMDQLRFPQRHGRYSLEKTKNQSILHFPMSKPFTDPLKRLHFGKMAFDDKGAEQINHWSHNHPLIVLLKTQSNNMLDIGCNDSADVCYGCVRPLSLPYYTCKEGCQFSLHKYCAELSLTLDHHLHPNHSLDLVNITYSKFEVCGGCNSYCNTFAYKCETCKFFLDVNCAFLPKTIQYKWHQHSLDQVIGQKLFCVACLNFFENMGYSCQCGFHLDMWCAVNSPHSLNHRYCKGHQIQLTVPPVADHPEDFYCDICESEIHPKYPLYHCHKCKSSFHIKCLSRMDPFANVWCKDTVTVSYHKHPLTYVRRTKTPRYVCFDCNLDIDGHLMLECQTGTCPFRICNPCHLMKSK